MRRPRTIRAANRAFTLVELLVVMGIIALLGALTVFSVASIFKDAKLSSATNTVIAALDNARALALKNNNLTMVVFRSAREGENENVVEIFTAQWTGQTYVMTGETCSGGGFTTSTDHYAPVPGFGIRRLPTGIKVAGPGFFSDPAFGCTNNDDTWVTQSHLPAIRRTSPGLESEAPGRILAVTFNGRGEVITTNAESDSTYAFVDFNGDFDVAGGGQQQRGDAKDYSSTSGSDVGGGDFYEQTLENDEPFVTHMPFLAVYDDDTARDQFVTSQWKLNAGGAAQRTTNLSGVITQQANRIHFNRYTGVVMK